jgi:hypothetical protein
VRDQRLGGRLIARAHEDNASLHVEGVLHHDGF